MSNPNHTKCGANVKVYRSLDEMEKDGVSQNIRNHNEIAAMQCSKRKKLLVQNNNAVDRKNKVQDRLRKKLEKRKQQY